MKCFWNVESYNLFCINYLVTLNVILNSVRVNCNLNMECDIILITKKTTIHEKFKLITKYPIDAYPLCSHSWFAKPPRNHRCLRSRRSCCYYKYQKNYFYYLYFPTSSAIQMSAFSIRLYFELIFFEKVVENSYLQTVEIGPLYFIFFILIFILEG